MRSLASCGVWVALALVAGCGGAIKTSAGADGKRIDADATGAACSLRPPKRPPLRRLNAREYTNALHALLGDVPVSTTRLPVDIESVKDFDTDGGSLYLLDLDAGKYYAVAGAAVDEALRRGSAPTNLAVFLRRAFRRSPTAAELARYEALAASAPTRAAGLERAMVAALVSPTFLFVGGAGDLDPHRLAERLALFLWSSIPDERLLALADSGAIARPEVIRREVARMVAEPAFAGFMAGFVKKWLTIDELDGVLRDPHKFPEFSPALLGSMGRETEAFVRDNVESGRPAAELVSAGHSFVDDRLAKLYGIDGDFGPALRRVDLPAQQRRGLLTHASIMTVTGATTTSPAHRGYWVTRKITCTEPPPPPPNVPRLPEAKGDVPLKERLEDHRMDVGCAPCHREFDPIGIGLEAFDGLGRWRTSYGKMPVDVSDTYHGQDFHGPVELVGLLGRGERFEQCLTENLATYALGRLMTADDACHLRGAVARARRGHGSVLELLQELAVSGLFLGNPERVPEPSRDEAPASQARLRLHAESRKEAP